MLSIFFWTIPVRSSLPSDQAQALMRILEHGRQTTGPIRSTFRWMGQWSQRCSSTMWPSRWPSLEPASHLVGYLRQTYSCRPPFVEPPFPRLLYRAFLLRMGFSLRQRFTAAHDRLEIEPGRDPEEGFRPPKGREKS